MRKKNFTTCILAIIFIAGLSLLLYPTVSNYINSKNQARAISSYTEKVAAISEEEYDAYMNAAQKYNESILLRGGRYTLTDEEQAKYESLLNLDGTGAMGYIEIPSIEVIIPIYHGTSEDVLQVAAGHLEWTSLPVGGKSTHSVLSGHRGLPSAKLFTHLDKLAEGDTFMIRVLDEVLTYEVDQILIVEPSDTDALQIVKGEDYCTLVTCTPYGINTHRLLVRGRRTANAETAVMIHITAEAVQIDPLITSALIGIPLIILLIIAVFIMNSGKSRGEESPETEAEAESLKENAEAGTAKNAGAAAEKSSTDTDTDEITKTNVDITDKRIN